MCYMLCDDDDDDLQAIRAMCEECAEFTEDDDCENECSSELQTRSDSESSTATEYSQSSSDSDCSTAEEDYFQDVGEVDESCVIGDTTWHSDFAWRDPASGTSLGYAACDEDTEEEAMQLGIIPPEDSCGSSAPLQITVGY